MYPHQRSGLIRDTHQLTAKIIFMLDVLPDQYYTCGMENIIISANFLRLAYTETKSKTMVHGFLRKTFRAIRNFVEKEDYKKDRRKADIVRGETKAVVLDGGVKCPDLVTFSVYETKTVHFLFMLADNLVCNINKKEIYGTGKLRKMSFYSYIALSCKNL